jgi:hypothetical protein
VDCSLSLASSGGRGAGGAAACRACKVTSVEHTSITPSHRAVIYFASLESLPDEIK